MTKNLSFADTPGISLELHQNFPLKTLENGWKKIMATLILKDFTTKLVREFFKFGSGKPGKVREFHHSKVVTTLVKMLYSHPEYDGWHILNASQVSIQLIINLINQQWKSWEEWEKDFAEKARIGVMYMHKSPNLP